MCSSPGWMSQNHLPHSLKHAYWRKNTWFGPFLGFGHWGPSYRPISIWPWAAVDRAALAQFRQKQFFDWKFEILRQFPSFWAIVVICSPSGSKVRVSASTRFRIIFHGLRARKRRLATRNTVQTFGPGGRASVAKSQKWAKSCVFMSIPMF